MALFDGTGFGKFESNLLRQDYRDTLRALYKRTGGYFFDEDTLRFFNSQIETFVIAVDISAETPQYVFVTSEQLEYRGDLHARKWSVRHWDGKSRYVDTVGDFQQYDDQATAMDAAKAYAESLVKV